MPGFKNVFHRLSANVNGLTNNDFPKRPRKQNITTVIWEKEPTFGNMNTSMGTFFTKFYRLNIRMRIIRENKILTFFLPFVRFGII